MGTLDRAYPQPPVVFAEPKDTVPSTHLAHAMALQATLAPEGIVLDSVVNDISRQIRESRAKLPQAEV